MFHNSNKIKRYRDAFKFIMDSPVYQDLLDYENEVLRDLHDKDNNLPITHPNYERMKAYIQGQIHELKSLISARSKIAKEKNYDPTKHEE